MAKPARRTARKPRRKLTGRPRYCSCRPPLLRTFSEEVTPERERLIRRHDKKWVNGTVLRYHFLDRPRSWRGSDAEKDVVRTALRRWKQVGIGLVFEETDAAAEAEVRIGFRRGDGTWSYLGRDVLEYGPDERTMNFGWDITRPGELDTAIHEIGHTLGFPHEHQNPFSGIVWDEEAVYAALAGPPNRWDRQTTWFNIIRKIDPDSVQGSSWDPDSIMHYPFGAGLIVEPERYRDGLFPAPGLSTRDREWVAEFYPPRDETGVRELAPFRSVRLRLDPGEQADFVVRPDATRTYSVATFGRSDSVLVLFERVDGELRYRTADDDSGHEFNAHVRAKLYRGREYAVRVRLYYRHRAGELGLMLW